VSELIIVDDFYSNPDGVRRFAMLNSTWLQQGALEPDFAGTESRQCFYSERIVKELQRVIGHEIEADPRGCAFGAFAVTSQRDRHKRHVHLDPTEYTAIIYLTPNDLCQGGTTMYRHCSTGLANLPTETYAFDAGYSSAHAYYEAIIQPDAQNENMWEEDIFVEMRYNRLMVFKSGSMFHCASSYFGTTLENSRLIQIFLFNRKLT
jgi:hypothetical protein